MIPTCIMIFVMFPLVQQCLMRRRFRENCFPGSQREKRDTVALIMLQELFCLTSSHPQKEAPSPPEVLSPATGFHKLL
jgi:hypothetical protein